MYICIYVYICIDFYKRAVVHRMGGWLGELVTFEEAVRAVEQVPS